MGFKKHYEFPWQSLAADFLAIKKAEVDKLMEREMAWQALQYWNTPAVYSNPPYKVYKREYLGQYVPLSDTTLGDWYTPVRYEPKEKMEAKNKKFWTLLCTHQEGLMSTVNSGRKYGSEYAALCDAEKYAKELPGTAYTVVEAKTRSIIEKPAVTTRLA